ncbi:hypothetical protein LX32DRAFT_706922 [Colletotrichum zoysiae]|uniref:Uncharacterized protein n=1 Tax=Colletotrichum zoysiae TaxID=1216348 RepID=A0AAD9H7E3_9PEZI|nr:hypothetical protein LX32DRAFT_706922 [Colletotrichum zoysiae]
MNLVGLGNTYLRNVLRVQRGNLPMYGVPIRTHSDTMSNRGMVVLNELNELLLVRRPQPKPLAMVATSAALLLLVQTCVDGRKRKIGQLGCVTPRSQENRTQGPWRSNRLQETHYSCILSLYESPCSLPASPAEINQDTGRDGKDKGLENTERGVFYSPYPIDDSRMRRDQRGSTAMKSRLLHGT